MVLGGRVNKSLVSLIQQSGGRAVGLSGKDGGLLRARQMVEKQIGFVGEVTKVDPQLVRQLVDGGYIPVVATVAADEHGQALNVNADTAAGEIAAALKAEKLILMTDVPGVLRDKDDVSTKFAALSIRDCRTLVEEGVIAGGMIPKVQCCIRCVSQGVTATHIIDGRSRHSILMELLTDTVGVRVVQDVGLPLGELGALQWRLVGGGWGGFWGAVAGEGVWRSEGVHHHCRRCPPLAARSKGARWQRRRWALTSRCGTDFTVTAVCLKPRPLWPCDPQGVGTMITG